MAGKPRSRRYSLGPPVPARGWGRVILRAAAMFVLALLLSPRAAPTQELLEGFELGGGIYLYHFAPLDVDGADANTEVYALFLNLDRAEGPFELHVQGRWRDTKLRAFFPSNVWLQEAWVAYTRELSGPGTAPLGLELRAGKFYQRIGRFWDASFFGNIQYFDGLKLDPEFGLEAIGTLTLEGVADLMVYGQLLLQDDRINGALPGRDLEGLESDDSGERGEEENGFAAGARLRLPLGAVQGRPIAAELGVSGLFERGRIRRAMAIVGGGLDFAGPFLEVDLDHLALDGELRWGDALAYVEWTRRSTSGFETGMLTLPGSRADYWLLGVQAAFGPLAVRYNYSRSDYSDAGFHERIHQPGITFSAAPGVHALVEYDDWSRDTDVSGETRIDRSLNLVLLLEF